MSKTRLSLERRLANWTPPAQDVDAAPRPLGALLREHFNESNPRPFRLTFRELETLITVVSLGNGARAAAKLGMSYQTLKNHMVDIMTKTETQSRAHAAVRLYPALNRFYEVTPDPAGRLRRSEAAKQHRLLRETRGKGPVAW